MHAAGAGSLGGLVGFCPTTDVMINRVQALSISQAGEHHLPGSMLRVVIKAGTAEWTMGRVGFPPSLCHGLRQQLPEISIASRAAHEEHLRGDDTHEGQEQKQGQKTRAQPSVNDHGTRESKPGEEAQPKVPLD